MTSPPLLTRVVLHNYKSIAACDVRLGALTYLVGPNGAGKSNFLDALQFVADALKGSLDAALSARWGIANVLHRNAGNSSYFGMRLEFDLPDGQQGHYAFTLEPLPSGGFQVRDEQCEIRRQAERFWFRIEAGRLQSASEACFPAVAADRLALVSASGSPAFRAVYDALSEATVYRLAPAAMRELQKPQDGRVLKPDGSNIASVLGHLQQCDADAYTAIQEYLQVIVPEVHGAARHPLNPMETLVFLQSPGGVVENRFYANSMSDGTLRALGLLTALFQAGSSGGLVGIEEPETALHPGAFAAVREAIGRAAQRHQIVVTSHSADLLDDAELAPERVLAVSSERGATRIAPLDHAARTAIKTKLFSAGELLRISQLTPGKELSPSQDAPDLWSYAQP